MKPKQLTNINNWNYNRLHLYLLKNIQHIENYQFSQYRPNLLIFISISHSEKYELSLLWRKNESKSWR